MTYLIYKMTKTVRRPFCKMINSKIKFEKKFFFEEISSKNIKKSIHLRYQKFQKH